MRTQRAISILVSLTALMAMAAGIGAAAPASAASHALIQGSGSSWASNAVSQWIADVQAVAGLQVVYNPDGSSAGKQDFANRTSDFAVTDVPYLGRDPVTGTVDSSEGREYGDIPIAAGAETFPYHLRINGKLLRTLRLSPLTLAKIFTNQITNWDNPAITADNNGVKLPSLTIIPVVPSEGSGVSYNVTTYLADRYPKLWTAFAKSAKPTEYFPRAGNDIAENGSEGMMNYITSSAADGTIGVVEYSYALRDNYPVASVQNEAGYFAAPTPYNVDIALRNATIDEKPADATYMRPNLKPVFASTDRRAYPLSFYSSMLIPTSATDWNMTTAKRQTLADFAYYAMCQGQAEVAPIGYAPLPLNLVKAGFTQIHRLKADALVDETNETVSTCHNPTFIPGDLARNYLGSIAPEPPACAKQGQGPCEVHADVLLTASTSTVKAGRAVAFHGQLLDRPLAGGPPHALVHLQRRLRHRGWKTIIKTKTSAVGIVSIRLVPTSTADYRLVDAEPGSGGPASTSVRVTVS